MTKPNPAAPKVEHPANALRAQPSPSVQGLLPPLSFGLWWSCSTASGKRVLFCLPFITNASSQPFPLFQPMPHFATQALMLFLQPFSLQPLTPPCVTGFFLITDPSSCYYSNPLLYNMPFYMRFHKGPIWSEGYGVRSWEMQLHGGNLCLSQNGGLTSSLLMHSSGHSGPSLTCWAHWIQ